MITPMNFIGLLTPIIDELKKNQMKKWGRNWARKSYPKSLKDRYGNLDLSGLDVQQEIKLCEIFFEQNVREDLNLNQPELLDPLEEDRQSPQPDEDRPLSADKSSEPVMKVLKENCRCAVILGGPGSGKSTLMQYLALSWAEQQKEESTLARYLPGDWTEEHAKQFPILIELEEYVKTRIDAESFLDFWYRGLGSVWKFDADGLQESLKKEPHLVMFDGLDEIAIGAASPSANRQLYRDIINKIIDFANRYPAAQVIVTSRLGGYNAERLHNANFRHLHCKI